MPTTYLSEVKPWGTFSRHDRTPALAARSARWYDGQLGRWISPDSIIPDPANPQSLNRFSYALGNPLKYRDPSGHQACQADDHACWQRRWYQAHGYEWLDDSWVYTGNYFFADKIAFVETIVDITEGRHLPRQFTGFTLVDGPLTYSIVQRGEDNILSKAFGAIAFVADTVDFAITSGFGAAYTIEQVVTAAVGGPPGALAGLLAGDAGYKAVNLGLLFVDGFGLGMIAGADIASGRSGYDPEAGQIWVGLDTLLSAISLSISAGSTALPVAPGVYVSWGGDLMQMTYDFLRACEILPGYSFQVQW